MQIRCRSRPGPTTSVSRERPQGWSATLMRMGISVRRGRTRGAGVNSARGWSRIRRAYVVELVGLLVGVVWFYFALLAPSLADRVPDGLEGWAYVGGLLLIPLVGASAMIVLGVRLRTAPVGLVVLIALGLWGVLPWHGDMVPRWGTGLVLVPLLAAVVTHPRPWGRQPGAASAPQVSSTAR